VRIRRALSSETRDTARVVGAPIRPCKR
jgi:hypothetical protein